MNPPAKPKCDGRQEIVRNSSSSGSYKGKGKINEKEKSIPVGFKLALSLPELTHVDLKTLPIPTQDAEKHFPPLKQPKGSYKEEKLLVSNTQKKR